MQPRFTPLPRSPIWKGIDRWEHLGKELTNLREQGATRLLQEFESKTKLHLVAGLDEPGVWLQNLREALVNHIVQSAERLSFAVLPFRTTTATTPEGWKVIHYGAWYCATVPPEQEGGVKESVAGLMQQADALPECRSMEQKLAELRKARDNVSQELTTLKLRRVVPGRCRYCPI